MNKRHFFPTEDQIANGVHYCSLISWDADYAGAIYKINEDKGELFGKFGTIPKRSPWSPLNLFKRPVFCLSDTAGDEVLQIRRTSHFAPNFEIFEKGNSVGRIRMVSILRNKYSVNIPDFGTWLIHMPLFTINFGGCTDTGSNLWIRVGPSKMQWNILLEPNMDNLYLLASLSFIHRQWWCFS